MKKYTFEAFVEANAKKIEEIRSTAWNLHESVGQQYDKNLPYGHHLSMVAKAAVAYGHQVIDNESDIIPVVFAAFFHDSIEDARLSYRNVLSLASLFMTEEQSVTAAEIVYALTNDKGRTRSERAGEKYYAGIRETPYAPFVKLCDRLANMTYSSSGSKAKNSHMSEVYASEWPHFIASITVASDDSRFQLPKEMILEIESLLDPV